MRLSHMTWPQVETYFKGSDMVLLSIGSIESHGRHMPLGTDTIIPEHLLEKIEKKSDVLIAPTIPFGACQSLAPFPGTIDIDQEILYQFCRRFLRACMPTAPGSSWSSTATAATSRALTAWAMTSSARAALWPN